MWTLLRLYGLIIPIVMLGNVMCLENVNENCANEDGIIIDCNLINDDLTNQFTTVEQDEDDLDAKTPESGPHRRQRRMVVATDPLEKDFEFTNESKYFYDLLDGTPPHDKITFHKQTPEGFAETDRTKLLLFDVQQSWYPPFTYRGLFGRNAWQRIPIESLMKKRNKSFMMLQHECEHKMVRAEEKECAAMEYPKLPSCKSEDQSPIDIDTQRARDSSLKEFEYSNLKDANGDNVKFPFMMSVPWDGTDILTVELLDGQLPPAVEKGSISGRKLYLERIHIHYGENETVGSEHTLNNISYSMELQFVFTFREDPDGRRAVSDLQYWDLLMEYYTDNGKANRIKNVHIIALWVKVIDDDKFDRGRGDWNDQWNQNASNAFGTLGRAARKFWAIHNTLQEVDSSSNSSSVNSTASPFKYRAVISTGPETLDLGAFFPPQVLDSRLGKWRDSIYYNYKGGITHPPCFGYVEWDIYDRPLYINTTMWLNFLYIHSEFDDTKYIAGNYRMPRHVYVEAVDRRRTLTWTQKDEEEREKVVERMRKRDLRKSKPTGTGISNYDYFDITNSAKVLLPLSHALHITLLSTSYTVNKIF